MGSDNFYITTSIPYVNGEPHLGHAMEFIMADVLARYVRQRGVNTLFTTGTDEHGGKVAEKAAEKNLTPQQFADQVSQTFQDLLKKLNVSNDKFIRTTDPGHEQRAQIIWKSLSSYIYKGSYEGWYCTGDEEYFSEKIVKANNGICPNHNRPYEKIKEDNYFFKLSTFRDRIKDVIEKDEFRIIPQTRKNEIMSVINSGLEDISISRPKGKISWGIAVPGDESQVMYVWFEALLNYITILGYPEAEDFKKFWPANVQVIGKGILRFHAAIWSGILLALNLPLPKTLYVHGYVTVNDTKMSKSLGNSIAPGEIIDKYGTDAFRYFFLRYIPSYSDGDFTWERFEAVYNSDLADQLGNALSRTVALISKYQDGLVGDIPEPGHDVASYRQAIENCRFDRALEEIWEQVKGLNQYIEDTKPWEVAKSGDEDHLREILAYQVGCLVEIASLLLPFLPDTAAKINETIGSGVLKPMTGSLFPKFDKKPDSVAGNPQVAEGVSENNG